MQTAPFCDTDVCARHSLWESFTPVFQAYRVFVGNSFTKWGNYSPDSSRTRQVIMSHKISCA